jgi:hypothetical protein
MAQVSETRSLLPTKEYFKLFQTSIKQKGTLTLFISKQTKQWRSTKTKSKHNQYEGYYETQTQKKKQEDQTQSETDIYLITKGSTAIEIVVLDPLSECSFFRRLNSGARWIVRLGVSRVLKSRVKMKPWCSFQKCRL